MSVIVGSALASPSGPSNQCYHIRFLINIFNNDKQCRLHFDAKARSRCIRGYCNSFTGLGGLRAVIEG